ncbi:divergent PAP2 family protein [Candidatus Woesearchaeota archaeon]|nr:divergent PAP2 family protein [Candidatus Woesearchaeota archaeon]
MSSEKVFLAVMLAGIVSQIIKVSLSTFKDRKIPHIHDLLVTGGMPSTHSAFVSSMLLIILLEEAVTSVSVIALVLFIIVITDSIGVRRTAGEDAKALNKIIRLEKLKIHKVHYALGHRPIEVLSGVMLGFTVALAVWLI